MTAREQPLPQTEDGEAARTAIRDRLADLADPDCERCEGSGLDPDAFTTSRNTDGQTIHHLTEPCRDCIDDDTGPSCGSLVDHPAHEGCAGMGPFWRKP